MKKNVYWSCKYLVVGAIQNIKSCLKKERKKKIQHNSYKKTIFPKVKSYFPENWEKMNQAERFESIGNQLLKEKLILKS